MEGKKVTFADLTQEEKEEVRTSLLSQFSQYMCELHGQIDALLALPVAKAVVMDDESPLKLVCGTQVQVSLAVGKLAAYCGVPKEAYFAALAAAAKESAATGEARLDIKTESELIKLDGRYVHPAGKA